MAKDLPCIASWLPALTKVIADLRLYGDSARRAVLERRARADALRRLHNNATIPEWARLYRELVATRNGRAS